MSFDLPFIKIAVNQGFTADRQIAAGGWSISLFGHDEERETGDRMYDVVYIRPLVPFRRVAGRRYRIANKAVILTLIK